MKLRSLVAGILIGVAPLAFAEGGHPEGNGELTASVGYLLDYVENSPVVFIRNGQEHTPEEAANLIRRKYRHFKRSIRTPEDFIRYTATRSILSGQPYRIRKPSGEEVTTERWLLDALEAFRARREASPASSATLSQP